MLATRIIWVAAACGLVGLECGTTPAHAEDLQAVVTGMRACAAEQDDARRLGCYDKQFRQGGLTPARGGPATASPATASPATASTAPSPAAPSPAAPSPTAPPPTAPPPTAPPPAITPPAVPPPAVSSPGSPSPGAAPPALTLEQRFGLNAQVERKEQGTATQPSQLDKLTSRIAAVSYKLRGEARVTLDNGQVWEQADTDSSVPLQPADAVTIRRGSLGSFWLSAPKGGFRAKRVR